MANTLSILKLPDPTLRQHSAAITSFDRKLNSLIEDLVATMRVKDGLGLSAIQTGKAVKLAVVEYQPTDGEAILDTTSVPLTILINPKITKYSRDKTVMEEGCLSVPNIKLEIERPAGIELINHRPDGQPYQMKADGLLARICQHEIDHMKGVLITDYKKQLES